MEKNEIIGKLSSYFKLTGPEAENIYKDIFNETERNGANGKKSNGKSPARHFIGYTNGWNNDSEETSVPVQKDENQLELEYDSFSEHRLKINKEIELEEESKTGTGEPEYNGKTSLQPEDTTHPEDTAPLQAPAESEVVIPDKPIITLGDQTKHPAVSDDSYYIWYKDAESTPAETDTLSYEYELMYQAAKESEYQSKMKIYAASFVFFFSFVLFMLILSPVIYKKYFVTEDLQSFGETLMSSNNEQKAAPNKLKTTDITENIQAFPSLQQIEEDEEDFNSVRGKSLQNTRQVENKDALPKEQSTVQLKQNEQPVTQNEPADLRKTSGGWADDKYNVLYIKLDNGKYTIQESSWDSNEKAGKRKAEIEKLGIAGLSGTVVETDLGDKGKWYRVRFGEFSTLADARKKVEEFARL